MAGTYTLTFEENDNTHGRVITKNITGTLEEIVTALEGEVPESSVFNHGFRYYRNPTEYEFVKDTTTGELYGPYSTFYVPDWMTEEDSLELGVEVINPQVEEDLDPDDDDYQDEYNDNTFMVLTEPLEYDEDHFRDWLFNYCGTHRKSNQHSWWSLTRNL